MSTNSSEKEQEQQQETALLENPERQASSSSTNANVIVNPLESNDTVDHTNATDDSPGTRYFVSQNYLLSLCCCQFKRSFAAKFHHHLPIMISQARCHCTKGVLEVLLLAIKMQ